LQVKTILMCKNAMLREGLKHTLSGTRFTVSAPELMAKEVSGYSAEAEDEVLFILDANLYQDTTTEFIKNTKMNCPGARVVVLADDFELNGMLSHLQAGADGYCLSTIGCDVLIKYLDLVMLGEVVFPSGAFLSSLSASDKMPQLEKLPI